MKVKLGHQYKDSITGFTGIATARSDYLMGCSRILLETCHGGDIKTQWIDENRLKDITVKKGRTGGEGATPPKRDPIR